MTLADVALVTELVAACELHHDGVVEVDREDIEVDWARPGFDLATESVGRRSTATAWWPRPRSSWARAEVNVHPD